MKLRQGCAVDVKARKAEQWPYGLAYRAFVGTLHDDVDNEESARVIVLVSNNEFGFDVRALAEDLSLHEESRPFSGQDECPRCGSDDLIGPDDEDHFDCENCGLVFRL